MLRKFLIVTFQAQLCQFKQIKPYQNVVELLKSATKWNARNRPGISADGCLYTQDSAQNQPQAT